MTVLFYIIVVCFALSLIGWSAGELFHHWQLSAGASLLYFVGSAALLVRLVVVCVKDDVLHGHNIWAIFTFVFAIIVLYLHFRIFGTMILPLASAIILIVEMLQHLSLWPQLGILVDLHTQPWLDHALVLAMIGLALALAWLFLSVSLLSRRGRLAEAKRLEAAYEEFADDADFRAHSLRVQFIDATRSMQRLCSHLGWWTLTILSFAIGGFVLWCYTCYGVYWLWQPVFALSALAWVLLFIGKDMLFACRK